MVAAVSSFIDSSNDLQRGEGVHIGMDGTTLNRVLGTRVTGADRWVWLVQVLQNFEMAMY